MRKVKLTFGERMREWRKARREYAEKVKEKVKEQKEIKDRYPPLPQTVEEKQTLVTSPTESTELKEEVKLISNPNNSIERAINHLREKIKGF